MIRVLAIGVWFAVQSVSPGAAGEAIVRARCTTCHETDLIAAQRLTRSGWTRELDKMQRWGAQVPDNDREPLLAYLTARFGVASTPVPDPRGEAVFKAACLTCHETDLIRQQRLGRAGWVREVDKMIRWGAAVAAGDKDALVDFLAGR